MLKLSLYCINKFQLIQQLVLLLLPASLWISLAVFPQNVAGAGAAATKIMLDRTAITLYYHNRPPNAKGDYHYEFQTSNGITTKAAGNPYGASGVFQYVSLEGVPITMTYIADANGYHPSGEHILIDESKLVHQILKHAKDQQMPNKKKTRIS